MIFITGPLAQAARLEAEYQTWIVNTQQVEWWPTATRRHFVASRLGELNALELMLRPIQDNNVTYGFKSLTEAKEYLRRGGVRYGFRDEADYIGKKGRLYFLTDKARLALGATKAQAAE
jgi:hypothetical protein